METSPSWGERALLQALRELLLAGCGFGDPADLRQNLVLAENQILLFVDLDVVAGIFGEQNTVARLHVERDSVSFFEVASTYGDHFTFLRLLFGCVGNDDAALRSLFLFQASYQN